MYSGVVKIKAMFSKISFVLVCMSYLFSFSFSKDHFSLIKTIIGVVFQS